MEVFGRYPRPASVEGCPCCVSAADSAALLAGSPDALRRYAHKAVTTWGGVDDFRHFLPRLLDAVAAGDVELDSMIGKLTGAGWQTWPADERAAVLARLVELWRLDHRIDLLDDLAAVGADPARLLDMLPADVAPERIAELLRELSNTCWRDERVLAWLRRAETGELLERAFLGADSDTLEAELYWAISELERMFGNSHRR